jgi:hypothetical protein
VKLTSFPFSVDLKMREALHPLLHILVLSLVAREF